VLAAVVLTLSALTLAGCGSGSPNAGVASLGTTTSVVSSNAGGAPTAQTLDAEALAFSHCMRANGVANYPDPNGFGVWPKSQVEVAASNPRFPAATHTCAHLLPYGGPGVAPSAAVTQLIQADMSEFARCMRAHGVPSWPDPTLDRGRAVFVPSAAGIDAKSSRILTRMHECEHVFPPSIGIPPGA
jgi:hypothetical protein